MVFDDGFFHGDPHPGNFFVQPEGAIAIVESSRPGDDGSPGPLADSLVHEVARPV
jgi:ubiquinone biosynthesis protein